jgi:Flp pilus assembly protein TadD
MNLRRTLFTAIIFATTLASASALEKPLWEELTKTDEMLAADREFVEAIRKVTNGDLKAGAVHSVQQGWHAFQNGDMDVAIRRFNQAWLLDPENGDIYWGFAIATHVRGDGLEQSERWFAEAERLIPNSAQLLAHHGRVLDETGQAGRARTYFEKALAIDPNDVVAHTGMVRVLTQLGDTAGADKHIAELKRLKKD